MTTTTEPSRASTNPLHDPARGAARRAQRRRVDQIFRGIAITAASASVLLLAVLLISIAWRGSGKLSTTFFTGVPDPDPNKAGIWPATMGTVLICAIAALTAIPIGVGMAILIEEFKPKWRPARRAIDFAPLNLTNLAGVPSIVFGLLGLAVFIQLFGLPRSAPLVGGLVLTLMTLPTIIIASRAALKGVPPSIREAALGMG
ncbi:MAG TPA: hypothetical protein PKB10_12830, partial [Tepidisphaeraceae bacterium]|nr:hypothetical protein [Tepidisphaeraceae bacterium]